MRQPVCPVAPDLVGSLSTLPNERRTRASAMKLGYDVTHIESPFLVIPGVTLGCFLTFFFRERERERERDRERERQRE